MSGTKKKISVRYVGYVLPVLLYFGWFKYGFEPVVLAGLSVLTVLYALFQAPVPCCARNRDGTLCRHNAKGLLRGCYIQQHKWQKVKMLIVRQSWAELGRRMSRGIAGNAAALSVLVGMVSSAAAVAQLFVG